MFAGISMSLSSSSSGLKSKLTECKYAADCLLSSPPQSWFLWHGLYESTAKLVSWKLEIETRNTPSLNKNRLLTLKRSIAITIPSTTEPENPHSSSRGRPIQHNLNRNVRPSLCRKLQWDWVDRLRMHGGGIARWGTVSHTHTPQNVRKKHNVVTWQMTNSTFVVIFYVLFFLSFCCLHNETPCIGWEINKSKR